MPVEFENGTKSCLYVNTSKKVLRLHDAVRIYCQIGMWLFLSNEIETTFNTADRAQFFGFDVLLWKYGEE